MTFFDIAKVYAELHDMKTIEVYDQYAKGLLTKWDLLNAFLENEGIFGYTTKIMSAFRCILES